MSFVNKTDSEARFVAKGVKSGVGYDPGLQRVEKRLAEKISEINLPFALHQVCTKAIYFVAEPLYMPIQLPRALFHEN
jgi:hypothetical protein